MLSPASTARESYYTPPSSIETFAKNNYTFDQYDTCLDKTRVIATWIFSIICPLFPAIAFFACWIKDLVDSNNSLSDNLTSPQSSARAGDDDTVLIGSPRPADAPPPYSSFPPEYVPADPHPFHMPSREEQAAYAHPPPMQQGGRDSAFGAPSSPLVSAHAVSANAPLLEGPLLGSGSPGASLAKAALPPRRRPPGVPPLDFRRVQVSCRELGGRMISVAPGESTRREISDAARRFYPQLSYRSSSSEPDYSSSSSSSH